MHRGRLTAGAIVAVLVVALALPLNALPAVADTVSVNCANASLQTKIDNASPGTVILVKGTCDGNFTVPKNLTLKGNPAATLDGGGTGSTLTVTGTRLIHLRSLVVTGGRGETGGGVDLGDGGLLTLDHVTVRGNVAAENSNGFSAGGGIYAADATLAIRDSQVLANRAVSTKDTVAVAHGGGIYLQDGTLTVDNSLFQGNRAKGVAALGVTDVAGGGAFVIDAAVSIDGSRFQGNRAISSSDESGTAQGGAVFHQTSPAEDFSIAGSTFGGNLVKATVTGAHSATGLAGAVKISSGSSPVDATVTDSVFQNNRVAASSAGSAQAFGGALDVLGDSLTARFSSVDVHGSRVTATGATSATGRGGGLSLDQGTMFITRSNLSDNTVGVHSGSNTALGTGGGIDAGGTVDVSVATSTIDRNGVAAVSDSSVANAGGGGYEGRGNAALTLRTSTVSNNQVTAVASNGSSTALGGGLDLESPTKTDIVVNSTITLNGASATGPNAIAAGGAAEVVNTGLLVRLSTIARNDVAASGSNPFAGGGGLDVESGTTFLHGTILAANTAATGPNCIGAFTTEGFNVYGDTTGCGVTPAGTDHPNVAPKLSALADHGGPTLTLALLAGSPALNKIPVAECHDMSTKDQRLVPRPQGPLCDIGAFERKP
ncbi:MAG TPA: choice-of-anchor Q domain-containing protein [Actinomycetota bacterium]